jgi:hypothetical protein
VLQIKHIFVIFLLIFFITSEKISAQVQIIKEQASPLSLSLAALYVDDINPTTVEDIAAYGIGLNGKGQLVTKGEGIKLLLDYQASVDTYESSEDNPSAQDNQDFYDYEVSLLSRFFISKRWYLDAQIKRIEEIQKFGTGISQLRNNILEADHQKQNSGALSLVYGSDTSSRYVSLKVFASDNNYADSNEYSTLFNLKQRGAELNLAYRQSSISSLLFRISAIDDNYASDTREDSEVVQALIGLMWQPTGKSKLEARLGMYWRTYATRSSTSGLSWLVNYSTEPTENWLLKLSSARFSDVSNSEFSSDSVRQNLALDISYAYSEQWKIGIKGKLENTEFNSSEPTLELDERHAHLYVALQAKKHSEISLLLGSATKSITDGSTQYQQSEVRLAWQLDF